MESAAKQIIGPSVLMDPDAMMEKSGVVVPEAGQHVMLETVLESKLNVAVKAAAVAINLPSPE